MGARTNMVARDEHVAAPQPLVGGNTFQVQGFANLPARYRRWRYCFGLLSDAAAIGAAVIAETALNASACPAPN